MRRPLCSEDGMAAAMDVRLDDAERALVRCELDEAVQAAEEVLQEGTEGLRMAAVAVAVQALARKACWMQIRPLMERTFGSFGATPKDVFLLWTSVEVGYERYGEVEGHVFLYLKELSTKINDPSTKAKAQADYDAVALFMAEKGLFQGEYKLEDAEKKFWDVAPLASESVRGKIRNHLQKNLRPPEPKKKESSSNDAHGLMNLLNRIDRGDATEANRDVNGGTHTSSGQPTSNPGGVYLEYALARVQNLKRMFDETNPTVRTSVACALGALFMYAWMQEQDGAVGLVTRSRDAVARICRSLADLVLGSKRAPGPQA